jgi:hypothetical protein
MTGQRSASVYLVLLLGAALAGSPPLDECAPPAPPTSIRPIAAPPTGGATRFPVMRQPAPEMPVPAVSVRVRVPSEAASGKELTYKILAENSSKASAHHVTVRVTIPGTAARLVRAMPEPAETTPVLVWKLNTLGPGARREITLVVMPTGDEDVSCCARVQFEHGQCVRTRIGKGATAAPAVTESTPPSRTPPLSPAPPPPKSPPAEKAPPEPPGAAELEFRKTGPAVGARYDMLAYKLEVRNVGRAAAKKVVLREALPKGIALSESKPAEASQNPLTWNLGDLEPGGSREVQYKLIPDDVGSLMSTISVEADGVARRESQHTLVVGQPGLAVSATGPKVRGVGRETTYHLTVSNPGNMASTEVQLRAELSTALQLVRGSPGLKQAGPTAYWNLGTLAPGASRTVTLVVKAPNAGVVKLNCAATAERGLAENCRPETTFVQPTGLVIEIDPERDPVEVDKPTQVVVRVHNSTRLNDNNVTARITLPNGLRLVELPGHKGHEVKGSTVQLPKRALAAGEDAQVVLSLLPEKPGPMKILAEVTSNAAPPDKAVKAEETITVVPEPTTSRKTSSW